MSRQSPGDCWPELTSTEANKSSSRSLTDVLDPKTTSESSTVHAQREVLTDSSNVLTPLTIDVDSSSTVEMHKLLEPLPPPPELPVDMSYQPSLLPILPFNVGTFDANGSGRLSDVHSLQTLGEVVATSDPPRYPVCQLKKEMSDLLYITLINLATSDIRSFECSGGSLQYQLGTLTISGREDITQSFLSCTVNSYSEVHLQVSPLQWKQLMEPSDPGNACKFKELSFPFSTNPNVKIVPIPECVPQLVFVGTTEAVESAYQYFARNLSKELPIDRTKWIGLNKLNPTFASNIRQRYGVVPLFRDGLLKFEGMSNYGQQMSAMDETEEALSKCFVECLKQPLSPILLASMNVRKITESNDVVVFSEEGFESSVYICGMSQSEVFKVKQIIEKPSIQSVNVTSSIMATIKTKCIPDVQKIEEECLVEICYEVKKILVKGYVEKSVSKAKHVMIELVKSMKSTQRPLSCSTPLCAYVHHVLFERELCSEHKKMLSALDTRVFTENNKVLLGGPANAIAKDEEKLLSEVVPKDLKFEQYTFSCNQKFIAQIEKTFLSSLHKKYDFIHLVAYPECERQSTPANESRRPSSGQRTRLDPGNVEGFVISIFSTNETEFSQISLSMKELNPKTSRFQIPVKSAEYVQKVKKRLESKYYTWIFVSKFDPSTVTLHGLRDSDLSSCKEEIEQSLFVNLKYKLTCHQLLYLRKRWQTKLEMFQDACHKFSLPPSANESKNAYVLIVGKSSDVEKIRQQLDEIVGSNHFKVEIFSLKCIQYMAGLWKRRWAEVKKALEEEYEVFVEFTQSEGPKGASRYGGPQAVDERHVVINFEIFGKNDGVDAVADFIKAKENGNVVQSKINLSSQCGKISLPQLVRDSKVQELKVWLRFEGSQLVLLAPESAVDDLEAAKCKLSNYFAEIATKTESIDCIDSLVFDVMMSNQHLYLSKVSECGKQHHVLIRINKANHTIVLHGCQSGINIVKPHVEATLQSVQKNLSNTSVLASSIQAPFLKTGDFKAFCDEIRKKKCVQISVSTNLLLKQIKLSQWLNVSIIKGDILSEDADAIVNAANEDLDHIGGLAKSISDAGGPEIQLESSMYVSKHGKVPTGSSVCLGSGKLSCKKIIHAVAPRHVAGLNVNDKLYDAVKNSLATAAKHLLTSIAIPALGTGIFSVPVSTCADASLKAVHDFSQENSLGSCLHDIRFVVNTQPACQAFSSSFERSFDNSLTLPSSSSALKTWKWLDDSHKFQSYDAQTCETLTESLSKNPCGSCTITINGTLYIINFKSMEQVNFATQNRRQIMLQNGQDKLEVDTTEEGVVGTVTQGLSENVQWYYKGDNQQWEPYLPHDSSQLEAWYQSDQLPGTLQVGKFTYSFDFESKTQTNTKTSTTRKIKRQARECRDDGSPKWCFQNDTLQFQPYSSHDSAQLEEWYQSKFSGGRLTIFGNVYSFNFAEMHQCNVATGKVRKIKREGDDFENVTKETVTLRLRGDATTIGYVQTKLHSKLESCLDRKDLDIPPLVELSSIKRVACKFPVDVRFVTTGKKTEANITGVKHVLRNCVSEMQSVIISSMAIAPKGLKAETPREWQHQQQTVQLFPVSEGSNEWVYVAGKFKLTMSTAKIISIERIQNQWLWQKYFQHKEMMHEKNKGAINEKELFHGTRDNVPKSIYSSEEGFDMRYSTPGMWGQANYFAVNARYSDNYAHTDSSTGHLQMFLARVLTGESYLCAPNRSLRMPPEKASHTGAVGGVQLDQMRYDTVTGSTNGSTVYMTYDNSKAYPAYLITYQRHSYRGLGIF